MSSEAWTSQARMEEWVTTRYLTPGTIVEIGRKSRSWIKSSMSYVLNDILSSCKSGLLDLAGVFIRSKMKNLTDNGKRFKLCLWAKKTHIYTPSVFYSRLKLICFINPFLYSLLVSFGLPSQILDLHRTKWALAFICFSFFFLFLITSDHTQLFSRR